LSNSHISGFYKLDVGQRIDELERRSWLSAADAEALRTGRHVLAAGAADRIIENVIGVFGLPFAVASNFRVNGRDHIVPMVVEEPSILAAVTFAATLALKSGGFEAHCDESLLAGQVHVVNAAPGAADAIIARQEELLGLANEVHPRLSGRGGGVRELEVRELDLQDGAELIVVHVLVDTCDAMGANLVNTICEAIAPRIAEISGGEVALRILSNLCDRSLVTARVRYSVQSLGRQGIHGEKVRDGVVRANDIAACDPHRAATHNKGIMNGIDPLAIATGNDWRAIEAGAHAYAASTGTYLPLTSWTVADNGDLLGEIVVPLKLGTVGGTLKANPAAELGLALTGVESATELACLMAATGLAQNFAALRALATSGIQEGHMRLHARSVAATAEVPQEHFETVVEKLVASGDIKFWKAQEILAGIEATDLFADRPVSRASGKVILLGEHAVVYGKHALALPVRDAVSAYVERIPEGLTLSIAEWQFSRSIDTQSSDSVDAAIATVLTELDLPADGFAIHMSSRLPRGMGLGSSAAFAVAIVRAFDELMRLGLEDERVNAIAFECEKLAHGTPSGVDNTLATCGQAMLFCNDGRLQIKTLELDSSPPLVVAWGAESGETKQQVAAVRKRHDAAPELFDGLFDRIDEITLQGADALQDADYEKLGMLMNVCHGVLNAIGVSTPELERMVAIARSSGATGAKLTGAGGGGSIVALCPGRTVEVERALQAAGFSTIRLADER